jgi:hypothetical protein
MNSAVVQNQDAPWSWIRIHHFEEALEPLNKLFAIVPANFDMCIDKTVHRDCGKK